MSINTHGETVYGPNIVVTIPKVRLATVAEEERRVETAMKRGEKGWRYFWRMGRLPKELPRRVYFLWDGAVRAYHTALYMEGQSVGFIQGNVTRIWLDPEVHTITPVSMKGFRGFRYWPVGRRLK